MAELKGIKLAGCGNCQFYKPKLKECEYGIEDRYEAFADVFCEEFKPLLESNVAAEQVFDKYFSVAKPAKGIVIHHIDREPEQPLTAIGTIYRDGKTGGFKIWDGHQWVNVEPDEEMPF